VGNARSKNARACGKFKARVREKENLNPKGFFVSFARE
jgi:hypothetical protein